LWTTDGGQPKNRRKRADPRRVNRRQGGIRWGKKPRIPGSRLACSQYAGEV